MSEWARSGWSSLPESETVAGHLRVTIVETIGADCAPSTVNENFQATFAGRTPTDRAAL